MLRLIGVEVGAVGADRALRVAHDYVLDACGLAHLADADACGTGSVHDHLKIGKLFSREFCIVHHAGKRDDRRPPLVIMENGDVKRRVEFVFDFKTRRRGDILEIDAAVLRSYRLDHFDDALGIGLALVRAQVQIHLLAVDLGSVQLLIALAGIVEIGNGLCQRIGGIIRKLSLELSESAAALILLPEK